MASKLKDAQRAEFKRYKTDVAEEGKSFFPYAMFHDTVMSLVVVSVIVVLTAIWYVDADGTEAGVLGPLYTDKAEPGTIDFVPRPDWFFYFLFYLLRIFKWPESVVLGTVGVPTILLVLLLALPFYDRSRERRPLRRPVAMVAAILTVISMGVLTYKGATAEEAVASEVVELVPEWAEIQGFADNDQAVAGAELFGQSGCLNCHVYLGAGNANLGAPDLTAVGATGRGVDYFVSYLENPAQYGNNVMISYSLLGEENLQALGAFLDASRGPQENEGG